MREQKPLYRKVNTRTHGVRHGGGDYSGSRGAKAEKSREAVQGSMHADRRRGLDYTPLYEFLLSRVGGDWNAIHSAAVARLDRADPIFHLVARSQKERRAIVRVGESTFYSGLFIDDQNRLALVDPSLRLEDMIPDCACCTHTFNGEPYVRKFEAKSCAP